MLEFNSFILQGGGAGMGPVLPKRTLISKIVKHLDMYKDIDTSPLNFTETLCIKLVRCS